PLALVGAPATPRPVRGQLPGRDVVGEDAVEQRDGLLALPPPLDRDEDLDAAIEVARHQVGAPEVELVRVAGLERVEAAVLEEPTGHRPDGEPTALDGGSAVRPGESR